MKEDSGLFNYLEFTRIDNFSATVAKLVDVDAPVIFSKRDIYFGGNGFKIKDLFAYKIKNLESVVFIKTFLKFEIYYTNGRVRIKTHEFYSGISGCCSYFILGEAARRE